MSNSGCPYFLSAGSPNFLPKILSHILSSVAVVGFEQYLSIEKHPYLASFFQSLPISLAIIVFIFSVFLIFVHMKIPTHIRYLFYVDHTIRNKGRLEK